MNAIKEIISLYENKDRTVDFWEDVEDYLRWGIVYSGPGMFMMYKMVNSKEDPVNQWKVNDPDAWFVKWAAGHGCISYMLSIMVPKLPKLIFFRHKNGEDSEMKTYDMEKFCRKAGA